MSFYREKILDHYNNPRNSGVFEACDCHVHLDNPLCGDEVDVYVKVNRDELEDISFQATGCAISIAAMSMLSVKLKGMSIAAVQKTNKDDIIKMIGIPLTISRIKCGTLGLSAVQACLKNQQIKTK